MVQGCRQHCHQPWSSDQANPAEAAKAVFTRCAAVLAPISLLLINYFPDQGRVYHVTGEMLYTGVATHKNSLGVMLLTCGMFILWDWFSGKRSRTLANASLLALMAWLLIESKSATSIVCAAFGALILLLVKSAFAKRHLLKIEAVVLILAIVVLNDAGSDILRYLVVDVLGRDLTLTTRTDFWPVMISMNPSDMFGAGFGSFWTGERLEQLYGNLRIVQAHNGYLETYLNGGFTALGLLGVLLLSALTSANRALVRNEPFDAIPLVFILIAMIYSVTEASFNTMSILWFAFLLNIVRYPNASVSGSKPMAEGKCRTRCQKWQPLPRGLEGEAHERVLEHLEHHQASASEALAPRPRQGGASGTRALIPVVDRNLDRQLHEHGGHPGHVGREAAPVPKSKRQKQTKEAARRLLSARRGFEPRFCYFTVKLVGAAGPGAGCPPPF